MGEKRPPRPTKSASGRPPERSKSAPASKLPLTRTKSSFSHKDKLKKLSYHSEGSDNENSSSYEDYDRHKQSSMRKLKARERAPSKECRADKKKDRKKKSREDRGRSRGKSDDVYNDDDLRAERTQMRRKKKDKRKDSSKGKRRQSSCDGESSKDKEKAKEERRQEKRKKLKKERKDDRKDAKQRSKSRDDKPLKKDKTRSRSSSRGASKEKKKSKIKRICCICRDKTIKELGGGLCDHCFCKPCAENLLHKPMDNPSVEDNHLAAPTLGRCPKCNTELRKFGLRKVTKSKRKPKKARKRFFDPNFDLTSTPLHGLVFQPEDQSQQLCSFHFDDPDNRPYMDFANTIERDPEQWTLNDGTSIPTKKYFEDGCFYDPKTRSFHGSVLWQPITFHGSHQWDIILGCNKKFDRIHVGVIHERKERQLDKKTLKLKKKQAKKKKKDLHRFLYPFDGRWKLYWKSEDGRDQTGSITVRNNGFHQGPYSFNLSFRDPTTPKFRWPLDPVYAVTKFGGNLKKNPMGPNVGQKIVWETSHPAFSEITWERLTIGELPIQAVTHLGIGGHEYAASRDLSELKLKDTGFKPNETLGDIRTKTMKAPKSSSPSISEMKVVEAQQRNSLDSAIREYATEQLKKEEYDEMMKGVAAKLQIDDTPTTVDDDESQTSSWEEDDDASENEAMDADVGTDEENGEAARNADDSSASSASSSSSSGSSSSPSSSSSSTDDENGTKISNTKQCVEMDANDVPDVKVDEVLVSKNVAKNQDDDSSTSSSSSGSSSSSSSRRSSSSSSRS